MDTNGPGWRERLMMVVWPSFVMAGVLETLVFVVVDPEALHWLGGAPIELSRQAVYTVAFFIFWGAICLAGLMTAWLQLGLRDPKP